MQTTATKTELEREKADEAFARTESFALDVVRLIRPTQWVKNLFVLAPLLFGGRILEVSAVTAASLGMFCFCLWSSAVYCLNDLLDAAADRNHPRKRLRPIAAGRLSAGTGVTVAALLTAGGAAIALTLPASFFWFGLLYLLNSLLYCILIKRHVIIDVISIAIGFVLRLLGGCSVIGVQPSPWIIICGFSLALLLGFGKRRLEVGYQGLGNYRPTLESYSAAKLDMLLGVTTAICLLGYMLYTVSPETVRHHQGAQLYYTIPFVAYGVFRYLFKVQEGKGDGPVDVLLRDPIFALNGLLWVMSILALIYLI